MKKRIISLVLVLCMVAAVLPIPADAATGSISDVDYTRIVHSTKATLPTVEFHIGGRVFLGTLENGDRLPIEKQDEIIKQVMKDYKMTSTTLYRYEYLIKEAAKANLFNPQAAAELGTNLYLGSIGADNVVNGYKLLTGQIKEEDIPGVIANTALSEGLSYIAGIAAGPYGPVAKMIVSGLMNATDAASREVGRLIEMDALCQEAVAAAMKLDLFYEECGKRIRNAEAANGAATWTLSVAHTSWCQKSLFGIPVLQNWRLSGELTRTEYIPGVYYTGQTDPTDYSGIYKGSLTIDIWHDLSSFDEQFFSRIFSNGSFPFQSVQAYFNLTDKGGGSTLTKTITVEDVEIHINKGAGTSESTFSLDGGTDTSSFYLRHPIGGGVKCAYFNSDGVFSFSGYGVSLRAECATEYNFQGALSGDNRYAQILLEDYRFINNFYLSAPYVGSQSWDHGTGGSGGLIMTDYQIFSDLVTNQGKVVVKSASQEGK